MISHWPCSILFRAEATKLHTQVKVAMEWTGGELYLQPRECKISSRRRVRQMRPHAPHRPYFKHSYQEVANKTSAVKFYRPVKCNLIKAVKCLPVLTACATTDSRMMEDAINGIINEPTRCLCDQMVSVLTYSNTQWEAKTVVIAHRHSQQAHAPPEPLPD